MRAAEHEVRIDRPDASERLPVTGEFRRALQVLVNLVGNAVRAVGWVGSLFQSGQVNTYAFFVTLGVLVLLSIMAL